MSLGVIDALAGEPAFHPGISNVGNGVAASLSSGIISYQRALIAERIPGIKSEFSRNDFSHTGIITLMYLLSTSIVAWSKRLTMCLPSN